MKGSFTAEVHIAWTGCWTCLEEWVPVNVVNYILDVILLVHLCPQQPGLDWPVLLRLPVHLSHQMRHSDQLQSVTEIAHSSTVEEDQQKGLPDMCLS